MTRSTSILIRVTPEEAEALKEGAKRAGLGVGPWLRSLGMREAADREPITPKRSPRAAPSR